MDTPDQMQERALSATLSPRAAKASRKAHANMRGVGSFARFAASLRHNMAFMSGVPC
ncbi:MAG: hypothetical protein ACTHJO_10110 [Rhodanobacter sp.]